MNRSKADWGQNDFRTLYLGFGFSVREGGNHTFYWHPKYPYLIASIGRHDALAKGYAEYAVQIIAQLQTLEAEEQDDDK